MSIDPQPLDPPGQEVPREVRAQPAPLSDVALAVLAVERRRLGPEGFRRSLTAAFPGLVLADGVPAGALGPELKGALAALAAAALIGAMVYGASLQGDSAIHAPTDHVEVAPPTMPTSPAEVQESLEARVAANPNDLGTLNNLTVMAMTAQDVVTATRWNDAALAVSPLDPEARVNRAIINQMQGMDALAMEQLDAILADTPNDPGASVYKGLMLMQQSRPVEALPLLQTGVAAGLRDPEVMAALADATAQAAASSGAPPVPAPLLLSGTIELDPAASEAAANARVLFVSARDPAGGPPIAAKKLPAGPFPMAFTLTEADRPMAAKGPMPKTFDVSVRADRDGNALSKDPTEPTAVRPGVSPGTEGLTLRLTVTP